MGMKLKVLNFISSSVVLRLFVKKLFFSYQMDLAPWWHHGGFLDSLFSVFTFLFCFSLLVSLHDNTTLSWSLKFYSESWNQAACILQHCPFSGLAVLFHLRFQDNFRIISSVTSGKPAVILIVIAMFLLINLDGKCHL